MPETACTFTGKLLSVPSSLGYQEQFRYVFVIGLLLLEKLRMSAKTYEFDYIRVFIEPDQQGIAFYVALHAVFRQP